MFRDRLVQAAATYRSLQSDDDGGWGEDRFPGAPRSLVNTAEVLAVLKAAGAEYDDEAVIRGLDYIREQLPRHYGPDKAAGQRGQRARYLAFGLWALGLFEEARHDGRWLRSGRFCLDRFEASRIAGGGWAEEVPSAAAGVSSRDQSAAAEPPASILSMTVAAVGLSRFCPSSDAGNHAHVLADEMRAVIASMCLGDHGGAAWPQAADQTTPSAAATARAAVALDGGDNAQRRLAGRAAVWLARHRDQWLGAVELDAHPPDANWSEMAFSLALCAMVRIRPDLMRTEDVDRAWQHLDDLWDPDRHEWSHGHPGVRPSPSGSYAVVAASEEMLGAWLLPSTTARRTGRQRRPQELRLVAVKIDREGRICVIGRDSEVYVPWRLLGRTSRRLIAVLAARYGQDRSAKERSLSAAELVERLGGQQPASIPRMVHRANDALRAAAEDNDQVLGDVIQSIEVAGVGASLERRWWLNVDGVEVDRAVIQQLGPSE